MAKNIGFAKDRCNRHRAAFAALYSTLMKPVMLMSNNRFVIAQELRQLVGLAGPLVFTQLAQMGMGVVDTVM
ncbi:MAG: hypothetical protein VX158_06200, partial [Pseudomonadota bacterium]|nr:hypothetical protein [Pseudomonadota bacterium]